MNCFLLLIFLAGIVASDNNTFDGSIEIANSANGFDPDQTGLGISWGEWTPCSRSCGGGISRQQKRCRRKPCKGRPWNIKYKVCNVQPCDKPFDLRAEQCSSYDAVPYAEKLLNWYPYYDPSRPCALICRGIGSSYNTQNAILPTSSSPELEIKDNLAINDQGGEQLLDSDDAVIVQLSDKVVDGTKCYPDTHDVCVNGECMKVGCDLRVGSNKIRDACGICGGDGTTCNVKYAWTLESTSACSETCGGGFKTATSVCKTTGEEETTVDNSRCDADRKPDNILLPCNTHPCSTKWLAGEWGKCSASCGGGTRVRRVFCIEENGNATSKIPDYKCNNNHKPKFTDICNAFSCPMWETGEWSECSSSCGVGVRRRKVECRDGNGRISDECEPSKRPRDEQECRAPANIDCSSYNDDMQQYPPAPVPEKLIDQPVPSQSTYIADEWSPCSVTCGEGIRHREVHCKIFLEFSRTIAKLPDHQCSGSKPHETEKCTMEPCNLMENSLAYRIDAVGDSGFAEPRLTDSFHSSSSALSAAASTSGGGGGGGSSSTGGAYESSVKVSPGSSPKTSYSWREEGYTDCSATCLGGVQDLIINCVRDDTGKPVMPLLCATETKPESRIRVCNDHPCPPRWNTSEFSACTEPCGLGIQTREVTCIHEVTRGTGNTVAVPNHMCPQPPPVDRQVCNVWDCPTQWTIGEWGKCSKTCGGGVKKRKVVCEQVMAQGRKQDHPERDCPSPKPHPEKGCNSGPCGQRSGGSQAIITSKNTTFVQNDPNKKVTLDIGGQATIFQGTTGVKIRCPVKKFDKAHLVWKKDHEEIHKSKKYKINKKGALKIMDINFSDTGIYSCWAGQTMAAVRLTVRQKPHDQRSTNEEVLRSGGNAVHQRQGAHLSSAPVNSEPFYVYNNGEIQESRLESQGSTEKPRRKKGKKDGGGTLSSGSTGKYDYSVTPQHQPVESSPATSGASTLTPHFGQIITTIKNYLSQDTTKPGRSGRSDSSSSAYTRKDDYRHPQEALPTTMSRNFYTQEDPQELSRFNFFNTAIPDNTFGPDEERIFIDDDPFDTEETVLDSDRQDTSQMSHPTTHEVVPTVTMINTATGHSTRHHHGITEIHPDRRHRGIQFANRDEPQQRIDEETSNTRSDSEVYHSVEESNEDEDDSSSRNSTSSLASVSEDSLSVKSTDERSILEQVTDDSSSASPYPVSEDDNTVTSDGQSSDSLTTADEDGITSYATPESERVSKILEEEREMEILGKSGKDMMRNAPEVISRLEENSVTPLVLGGKAKDQEPTIGSVVSFTKAKDDLIFEWVTTPWSPCSQSCGGEGFQMRGAQCTVRSSKNETSSKISPRTVIGANLCEDAGYPVPLKVRTCGSGRCPQWYAGEWSSCESSRCFNWKTAMQRREITCRLAEDPEDKMENKTNAEISKCDEAMRPPQRQECYNEACKGVWRVGEWSECSASCEEDGIKYRILQCVWYGTKKPAGNACRDIPRPPVMKTCRGQPCPKTSDDCKDSSPLCGRVKMLGMCRVPLYLKKCCGSCSKEKH